MRKNAVGIPMTSKVDNTSVHVNVFIARDGPVSNLIFYVRRSNQLLKLSDNVRIEFFLFTHVSKV